jgi:Fe2+ or Zn2+ uptake regulation protein
LSVRIIELKGYQASPQQELIYRIMKNMGWLSTKEISAQVQKSHPEMNYTSIRRALNRLADRELIYRIEVFDRDNIVTGNHAKWCILWRRVEGYI